ncbi:MAG: NAD kinase [Micrococcales bacterium]|nr:NAD kinase [Micrococcales bacterium]
MRRALICANLMNPAWVEHQRQAEQLFHDLGWEASIKDDAGPLDVIVVLGGDGTLLYAAEIGRERAVPLLGVNLGHLGFLSECDVDQLAEAIDRLDRQDFTVEERATLSMVTEQNTGWALNEITVEKESPKRMVEVLLEIDGRAVSTFGCDGLLVATSTGSTGHAFSGGGPILWPEVQALVVVPLAAHALFARPMVVAPDSVVAITVRPDSRSGGVVACDARRSHRLEPGQRLEITSGQTPVRFVRFGSAPFAERLVRKFALPVQGWRSAGGG